MKELMRFNKDVGSALVKEAQESQRKRISEQCVGEVESILAWIAKCENDIEITKTRLALFRKRLVAVESGAVTIDYYTQPIRIVYNDESLRPDKNGGL